MEQHKPAVGDRDATVMATRAGDLLAGDSAVTVRQRRYLVAVAMLGHLGAGEREAALGTWTPNRDELYGEGELPLVFRILVAHARKGPAR